MSSSPDASMRRDYQKRTLPAGAKGGFAGRALYTYRYSYTPRRWTGLLERAGFRDVDVRVVDAPEAGHIGTLLVTARR